MEIQLSTALIGVVTFISPLIASWFMKVTYSQKTKSLIALAVSAVIAVAYVFTSGGFEGATLTDFAEPLAVVFGTMQAVYHLVLKKLSKKVEQSGPIKATQDPVYAPKHLATETPAKG